MEPWSTLAAERLALADTLDALTPEQWSSRSLCSAWTAHDVAVHYVMSLGGGGLGPLLKAAVRARGNLERASRTLVAQRAHESPEVALAALRELAESRVTPPLRDWRAPLAELMVHGADIVVPLGVAHDRPAAVWAAVLDFLVEARARRGFVSGRLPALSYVALDADWTHQVGFGTRQVVGPARELALAMSGRASALTAVHGAGVQALATWLAV